MSSTRFNDSNADLKVRSSDGVEFDLHRALLATHTGAFPGPEIDRGSEVVDLTEPANVLRICFDFVYPRRHPDLQDVKDFELLAAVAEAVGKYEIFSAINTCNMRLRSFLPSHPAPILMYAIKHDHPRLIDEAAEYLVLSSFTSVLKQTPSSYVAAWALYHEAWMEIFQKAFSEEISKLKAHTGNSKCHSPGLDAAFTMFMRPNERRRYEDICPTCRYSLVNWVMILQGMKDNLALVNTVKIACERSPTATSMPCCCATEVKAASCPHMANLAKFIQLQIEKIPPFTSFLDHHTKDLTNQNIDDV